MAPVVPALMASVAAAPALYAIAGVQAVSGLMAARTEAKGYAAQATMARVQARQEALKYKQQGVAVLDNILRTQSAITARSAAGSLSSVTGTPGSLAKQAIAKGTQELYTTMEGQVISIAGGEMRAGQYMTAAKGAIQKGIVGAATQIGGAYATQSMIGAA